MHSRRRSFASASDISDENGNSDDDVPFERQGRQPSSFNSLPNGSNNHGASNHGSSNSSSSNNRNNTSKDNDIESGLFEAETEKAPRKRKTRFSLENFLSRVSEDEEHGSNTSVRNSLVTSLRSSMRSEQSSEGSHLSRGSDQQISNSQRRTLSSLAAKFLPRFSYDMDGSVDEPARLSSGETPQMSKESIASRRRRRYGVGEYVLISNHNCPHPHKLVNQYGFPSWWWNASAGGMGDPATPRSSDERRGPFCYLLARVVSVHFEEDAQYYTVKREDDNEEQRADAEWMEPIRDPSAFEAAKAAAEKKDVFRHIDASNFNDDRGPLGCIKRYITSWFVRRLRKLLQLIKRQADACLNGKQPYSFSVRITGINILVICSIWYLYIDQLRLAFFPHSADFALAIVSCIVWMILFLELMFEIFIRPDGYYSLLRSDKAYLPSTVRYLSTAQFILEMVPLSFFIPEFLCIFDSMSCGCKRSVSLATCTLMSVYGPTRLDAFYGRAFLCIMRLRIFGLVRHWKKMWINNTFVKKKSKNGEWRIERGKGLFVPQGHKHWGGTTVVPLEESTRKNVATLHNKKDTVSVEEVKELNNTDDYHLTNASNIGTALLTTNTERGLFLVFFISLSSLIRVACMADGGTNHMLVSSVEMLQANNLAADNTRNETCNFFRETVFQWVASNVYDGKPGTMHLLSLEIEPVRCPFQKGPDTVLSTAFCGSNEGSLKCASIYSVKKCRDLCDFVWETSDEVKRQEYYEYFFGIRPSVTFSSTDGAFGEYEHDGELVTAYFSVTAVFNETKTVAQSIVTLFLSQLGFTLFVLVSLSVLRYDAGRLVLGPLRRMLKIVAFYAKNPLSPPPTRETNQNLRSSFQKQNELYCDSDDEDESHQQLGTYETEQLINTVTKITDLLRKCWGVAGAGIISSNLARQEGGLTTLFNPTVPGEAVYALFAFVAIDKFQQHLHCLKGDIMILINDIAAVLHEEVYRWGYEDRGQCNKNLGGAFLMVYRIGTVAEVLEKRDRAEAVIFSTKGNKNTMRNRRKGQVAPTRSTIRNARNGRMTQSSVDSIDLSSLPGIRSFTDRAMLGLLKTFAGIHRDETLLNWQSDFRLGAGVHATAIELIFGMDAGWAVEGAVGSAYKIDATYLSPHVNMASRMMSATKQYGVFFLFSQAVQGLLSDSAKEKLRHIDTVTVKGSSVQQKIYTYDAKVRSDFFLYGKTGDQADLDSERYSPAIWDTDQDIVAMRNHIDDEFMRAFNRGRDEYLSGNWSKAITLLKKADKIMFDREVDEGYVSHVPNDHLRSLSNVLDTSDKYDENPDEAEEKVTRLALGDGPCQRLVAYMTEMGGEAPDDWAGYRPLTSK